MEPIVNRVAESDIRVFNLEEYWDGAPVKEIDIEPFLVEGLVLRERSFRADVKEHNWSQYEGAHVAVYCSSDAIIPTWAYMLIATKLKGIARSTAFGRAADLIRDHFMRELRSVDWEAFRGRNVVVKGCGSRLVPLAAYVEATTRLQEVADKLMFGEPCSSVPLWRRPSEAQKVERKAVRPVAVGKLPPGM